MTRTAPRPGIQQRQTLDLLVREVNADERRVTVSFSSEQAYSRWFGVEILSHDVSAVDLSRLQNIGVALFNHNRDKVIGRIENARLDAEEKRAYCDIVFDDDEETEKVFKKVQSGTLKGVSVGYSVDAWEEVAAGKKSSNGRFDGPAYVATKWTPMEVSIVSVPADDSVGVGREIENINIKGSNSSGKEERENIMNLQQRCAALGLDYGVFVARGMTEEQIKAIVESMETRSAAPAAPASAPATQAVDTEAERQAAVKAERQRAAEITEMCRECEVDPKVYIDGGHTVDAVRSVLFEKMKAERQAPPASAPRQDIRMGEAEEDKIRAAASDGIMMREGERVEKPAAGAQDFRGMSIERLAMDCLVRAGFDNAMRMSPDELFRAALTPDSQLSSIFTETVQKSMARAYNFSQPSCDRWVGVGSNRDFKATQSYQISEAGELKLVSQQSEHKYDEMTDQYVSKKVETRSRAFGFTRQALINDDLGVLVKVPMAYVRAGLRTKNREVYKILGNNANITYTNNKGVATTKALFHTDHNNIQADGGAPSTATIKGARAAMRTQKNLRGTEILNIQPKFLIVPAALETDAEQLVGSLADPSAQHAGVVNPFRSLQVVGDGELDGLTSGSTGWFLAADPMDCGTIEVTYLNGQQSPILFTEMGGTEFLGQKWLVVYDFGVTVEDFRGLYYNDGTAST